MKKRSQRLKALYAQVPAMECKGLCTDQCSIIGMTELERDRMLQASGGKQATVDANMRCGYLTSGRCDVYDTRPMVCRIFGAAEDLRCKHGCRPKALLSARKGHELLDAVRRLGGIEVFNITLEQAEDFFK